MSGDAYLLRVDHAAGWVGLREEPGQRVLSALIEVVVLLIGHTGAVARRAVARQQVGVTLALDVVGHDNEAVLRQPFSRPVVEVLVGLDRTVGEDDTGIAAGRQGLGLRRQPDMPAELCAVTGRELHLDGLAAGQPPPAVDRTEWVGAERARDLRGDAAMD